ncbi:MAG: OadG family protein [Deltaproteobacteria bacterium]|nr:OadG family protein [Deltaproteobacteria bacterium]
MSSVLLAAGPQNLPEGLPGALVVLGLGITVVFAVLGGLTLLIWLIGRVAREQPPRPDATEPGPAATAAKAEAGTLEPRAPGATAAEPPTTGETAALAAALALEVGRPTAPVGGPFTSAELAAVTAAVALEASGRTIPVGGPFTSAELAAVAAAVAQAAGGSGTAEAAAIAAAIRCREAGLRGGAVVEAVRSVPEPGAGAWGEAAFAGRGGAGLPVLRRG